MIKFISYIKYFGVGLFIAFLLATLFVLTGFFISTALISFYFLLVSSGLIRVEFWGTLWIGEENPRKPNLFVFANFVIMIISLCLLGSINRKFFDLFR